MLDRFGIKRPLRYLLYPGSVHNALSPNWFGQVGPEHSGLYKVRIQASGIRPIGGQTAHLSIGKRTGETVDGLIEFDITAPEDSPQMHEFELFLEMPMSLDFCVVATDVVDRRAGAAFRNALNSGSYIFTHSSETGLLNPNAPQMFDGKGNGLFSTVLLDWIEWEGPLETDAEKSRRDGLLPPDDASIEVVAEHLQRFAERAWRRPVTKDELSDYLQAYRSERDAGEKPADAYRVAMQGVLTSRHFIYLVEGDAVPRERLNDWELASRLSYFLWSSMPDDELFAVARAGTLTRPDVLRGQLIRMLGDPKIKRFTSAFPRQWLQLHRVGQFPADAELYPDYDKWLEDSMVLESTLYFDAVFEENLSLREFLVSDWTMLNPRLALHYGMPPSQDTSFQKVKLRPEDHRGGLLTHASVLSLTSDGTRHRPVHRGVWVVRSDLRPNSALPAAERRTARADAEQQTEGDDSHATRSPCQRMRPVPRVIGRSIRSASRSTISTRSAAGEPGNSVPTGVGDNPVVDASGVMPDGRSFQDTVQFKQLLISDRAQIARAFIEHLCTYALRRVLTVDDQDDLKAIETEAKKNQFQVKDIVRAVALSDLFRKR